jgi:hypothetical protein
MLSRFGKGMRLWETAENLTWVIRCPGLDSNQAPLEYTSTALHLG